MINTITQLQNLSANMDAMSMDEVIKVMQVIQEQPEDLKIIRNSSIRHQRSVWEPFYAKLGTFHDKDPRAWDLMYTAYELGARLGASGSTLLTVALKHFEVYNNDKPLLALCACGLTNFTLWINTLQSTHDKPNQYKKHLAIINQLSLVQLSMFINQITSYDLFDKIWNQYQDKFPDSEKAYQIIEKIHQTSYQPNECQYYLDNYLPLIPLDKWERLPSLSDEAKQRCKERLMRDCLDEAMGTSSKGVLPNGKSLHDQLNALFDKTLLEKNKYQRESINSMHWCMKIFQEAQQMLQEQKQLMQQAHENHAKTDSSPRANDKSKGFKI